jgi:DNA-binding phage protein
VNYLDDLRAEVERRGIKAVAAAAQMNAKQVRLFLSHPMNIRISTLSRLSRACDMPIDQFHLVDIATGECITCGKPEAEHYPLLPEAVPA